MLAPVPVPVPIRVFVLVLLGAGRGVAWDSLWMGPPISCVGQGSWRGAISVCSSPDSWLGSRSRCGVIDRAWLFSLSLGSEDARNNTPTFGGVPLVAAGTCLGAGARRGWAVPMEPEARAWASLSALDGRPRRRDGFRGVAATGETVGGAAGGVPFGEGRG